MGIDKAKSIPQEDLRKTKRLSDLTNTLPFITTYNPNNPNIYNIVKKVINNLKDHGVPGFKDIEIIQSKRQAPNLKKILTKVEFSNKIPMVRRCNNPCCECCNHLKIGNKHIFKSTQFEFKLKTSMSCDSSNLIYVLICDGCQEE